MCVCVCVCVCVKSLDLPYNNNKIFNHKKYPHHQISSIVPDTKRAQNVTTTLSKKVRPNKNWPLPTTEIYTSLIYTTERVNHRARFKLTTPYHPQPAGAPPSPSELWRGDLRWGNPKVLWGCRAFDGVMTSMFWVLFFFTLFDFSGISPRPIICFIALMTNAMWGFFMC